MNIDYDLIASLGIQTLAYERSSIERCKMVFSGAVVFDLGASNGLWSHAALQASAKKVIAFEQAKNPDTALKKNLSAFDRERYDIVWTFVTDKIIPSAIPPMTTIDHWIDQNHIDPDFVKIDIEGNEIDALKGMEYTIKRLRGKLFFMIEVHGGEVAKNKIVQMIRDWTIPTGMEVLPSGENWILGHLYHLYYLPRDI